jgi:hypothetical protein
MTLARFAIAVGASPKWVQNAAAVLGFRLDYTTRQARRLGLTRVLSEEFGLRLERAWKIAEAALFPAGRIAILSDDEVLHMIVDTGRYLSDFAVRLAVANAHYEPAKRGRPSKRRLPADPVERARKVGIDVERLREALATGTGARIMRLKETRAQDARLLELLAALVKNGIRFVLVGDVAAMAHGSTRLARRLEICYDAGKENAEALVKLLARWHPYPRDIEKGIPFTFDEKVLLNAIVPLRTDIGAVDLFRTVPGVGEYTECRKASGVMKLGEARLTVLDLEGLIASRRATERPRDRQDVIELEALQALGG